MTFTVRLSRVQVAAAIWLMAVALVRLPSVPKRGSSVNLMPDLGVMLADVALNVALFAPLGAMAIAAGVALSRWWAVLLMSAAVSLVVEIGQWYVSNGRVSDVNDVIANVLGAAMGFLAAEVLRRRRTGAARRRQPPEGGRLGDAR